MDPNFLLDGLLLGCIVFFVPIGLWRGGTKEVCVTAAVLLGAAGADASAVPLGNDLAGVLGVSLEVARFLVAMSSLAASTVVLGYGAALMLRSISPTLPGRLVGGLLAGINGILFVSFSLRFVVEFLLDNPSSTALDDGLVAGTLIRQFSWILLALGAAALGCVVLGAIVTRGAHDADQRVLVGANNPAGPASSVRPVRVPRAADAGKEELDRSVIASAIRPVESTGPSRLRQEDDATAAMTRSSSSPREVSNRRITSGWQRPADFVPDGSGSPLTGESPPVRARSETRITNLWEARPGLPANFDENPAVSSTNDRCLACGTPLRPAEQYCPECGAGR